MRENKNFIFLGQYKEISPIVKIVSLFTQQEWTGFKERKHRGGAASTNTDSIPILWGKTDSIGLQKESPYHSMFFDCMNNVCSIAQGNLGKVTVKRAVLARLCSGSSIPRHKDVGSISAVTHRIHLPLITDSLCTFTVADETIHMSVGELWIIDNTDKFHSVDNKSSIDRVHLIIDVS